eukprot:TRINITY_DN15453_c0_g1_i2.p2 TRINITY_DN15453_c0_g1~~TRINITY_DN15453_c0_g1_i2.p2  ORF type:complete len:272 (+),score=48.42 TRINITY_DN15453_c0_g1_i2:51-866(+)
MTDFVSLWEKNKYVVVAAACMGTALVAALMGGVLLLVDAEGAVGGLYHMASTFLGIVIQRKSAARPQSSSLAGVTVGIADDTVIVQHPGYFALLGLATIVPTVAGVLWICFLFHTGKLSKWPSERLEGLCIGVLSWSILALWLLAFLLMHWNERMCLRVESQLDPLCLQGEFADGHPSKFRLGLFGGGDFFTTMMCSMETAAECALLRVALRTFTAAAVICVIGVGLLHLGLAQSGRDLRLLRKLGYTIETLGSAEGSELQRLIEKSEHAS